MENVGNEVAFAGIVVMCLLGVAWDIRQARKGAGAPHPERFPAECIRFPVGLFLILGVALLGEVVGRIWGEELPQVSRPAWGMLVGAVTVWLACVGERCWSGGEFPFSPWLFGATGAFFAGLLNSSPDGVSFWLGGIVGAVLLASLLSLDRERRGLWGWDSAWAFALLALALSLARQRGGEAYETVLVLLVLVVMVAAIGLQLSSGIAGSSEHLSEAPGKDFPPDAILDFFVVFGVGAWLLGVAYLEEPNWVVLAVGGSLLSLFSAGLVGQGMESLSRLFLAGLLWVLWATVSFGLLRGYGIGVAVLSGALTAQVMGFRNLLSPLGLACGLLLYRLFMSLYGGEFTTLEIGQHYVFVGILLGALLPVTLWEAGTWLRESLPPVGAGLACVVLGVVVAVGGLFLPLFTGVRGALGLIGGIAVSPMLLAARANGVRVSGVVLPVALGALYTAGYKYMGRVEVLDREEKIRWAMVLGVILLGVILVGSWLVSRVGVAGRESRRGI